MTFHIGKKLIIISFIILQSTIFAQQIELKGKIIDSSTGRGIGYAIIKLINTSEYTCANSEGSFNFTLPLGKSILLAVCTGYEPDTLFIDSVEKTNLNFYLKPLLHRHITQNSGKHSSASEIVRHAVSVKEKMYAGLMNYDFNAYHRCVTRENNDVGLGTGSIKIDPSIIKGAFNLISNIWETKPLKIDRIDEFTSRGYYKKPDSYREIVEEQSSRSVLPSSLKSLLGTRRIQNLCGDELLFFDRYLPGPVSAGALDYYRYNFEDTLLSDHQKLFKIHFEPADKNDPGLIGDIYINDSSGYVLKVEANLNRAANIGNSFDSVSLVQQFVPYKDRYILPVNYLMLAKSNYIGIVKIRFQYSALIENYNINENENDNIDEDISVLQSGGRPDTVSWGKLRAIPFTKEEADAYEYNAAPESYKKGFFYDAARIFSPQYRINDHYSVSGPLAVYHFNHVEGHSIGFALTGNNLFNNTLDAGLTLSNGFSDQRFKETLSGIFYADSRRTLRFSFSLYNNLSTLFSSSRRYNSISTTIFSLLSAHDFQNYYYKKGFDLGTSLEVSKAVSLYASYSNHVDQSAETNTTFSLLGGARQNLINNRNNTTFADSVNPPVYDAHLNTIGFGVNFDFRDNVLENNRERKVSNGHSFVSFGGGVLVSSPVYLGSRLSFISYNSSILGEINTFGTSSLGVQINGIYSRGPVPIQMQYALPGNVSATGRDYTFRTLGVGRMFGDQVLTLSLEYNFRKEIYRLLPVSLIRNLVMSSFFNAAWKNMSGRSAAIMPVEYSVLTKPLLETGFSIGYSSLPVNIEFAWRLTHIERSGFRIGINTSIL